MIFLWVPSAHSDQREGGEMQPWETSHGEAISGVTDWRSTGSLSRGRTASIAVITTASVFTVSASLNPNTLISLTTLCGRHLLQKKFEISKSFPETSCSPSAQQPPEAQSVKTLFVHQTLHTPQTELLGSSSSRSLRKCSKNRGQPVDTCLKHKTWSWNDFPTVAGGFISGL